MGRRKSQVQRSKHFHVFNVNLRKKKTYSECIQISSSKKFIFLKLIKFAFQKKKEYLLNHENFVMNY